MRTSFLRWLPAALLPLLVAGCLPNATWLPDSSGFVYTGGKNKDALFLYDLAKKAPRVLVEKGAGPAWPAVSPDGKRIAVALRSKDGANVALEVIVFDRDGKELQRSEKMNWAKHEGSDQVATQAFWVPGHDKLLLSSDGVTGFYDLKTRSFTTFDVAVCTFGATPIRPDGKGFLAIRQGETVPIFMDWDGKEKEIQPTPKDVLTPQGVEDPLGGMISFPMMYASRWDGSTAVVSWNDERVKIDADKLTASLEHFKPTLSADKKVIQEEVRLSGGGAIRAVELTKRYKAEGQGQNEPFFGSYRVEVVKPGAKEPKVTHGPRRLLPDRPVARRQEGRGPVLEVAGRDFQDLQRERGHAFCDRR